MKMSSGIINLVYELKKKCLQVDQQMTDDLGISQSELLFFSALNNCQGISSHELAKNMGLSPSRISRVIEKLVVNGFLDRNNDSTDRRVITLCLTSKGKAIRGRIDKARNECESRLFESISTEEIEQFKETVSKIVMNM